MDIKQLRAFVTVAETGNVTRAAELLHVVQPSVSRQLRLLEEDVGRPLFERMHHRMDLTDAGKKLILYARRILGEIERARAEINPIEGEIGGIVAIGLLPSTADLLADALMEATNCRFPSLRLRITTGYAGDMQKWLEDGELDLALLYAPQTSTVIRATSLLEEPLLVVGLPSEHLRPDVPVPLASLVDRPIVLPSASHGLRMLVDHACLQEKIQLKVVAETNAMSVQKSLVLGGRGLTILPSIAVTDDLAKGALTCAPLAGPSINRRIVLALPANREIHRPVRTVAGILEQSIKSATQDGSWIHAKWLVI